VPPNDASGADSTQVLDETTFGSSDALAHVDGGVAGVVSRTDVVVEKDHVQAPPGVVCPVRVAP
jgi:hypothetical protein